MFCLYPISCLYLSLPDMIMIMLALCLAAFPHVGFWIIYCILNDFFKNIWRKEEWCYFFIFTRFNNVHYLLAEDKDRMAPNIQSYFKRVWSGSLTSVINIPQNHFIHFFKQACQTSVHSSFFPYSSMTASVKSSGFELLHKSAKKFFLITVAKCLWGKCWIFVN